MSVLEVGSGVMIRAADAPIFGDVNYGAKDAAVLKDLAAMTRELRISIDNLGPDDPEFAERWLSRFDT